MNLVRQCRFNLAVAILLQSTTKNFLFNARVYAHHVMLMPATLALLGSMQLGKIASIALFIANNVMDRVAYPAKLAI